MNNKAANDVITKTQFSTLVSKVHSIDTTDFVKITKYEKDGSDFEDKTNNVDKKIPDISGFIKKQILIPKLLKQRVLSLWDP